MGTLARQRRFSYLEWSISNAWFLCWIEPKLPGRVLSFRACESLGWRRGDRLEFWRCQSCSFRRYHWDRHWANTPKANKKRRPNLHSPKLAQNLPWKGRRCSSLFRMVNVRILRVPLGKWRRNFRFGGDLRVVQAGLGDEVWVLAWLFLWIRRGPCR